MSGYIIRRTTDRKYVSRPGSEHSYTKRLENARVFPTREAAQADLCPGNERIVPVDELVGGGL